MREDRKIYIHIPYNDVLDAVETEIRKCEYIPRDDMYHKGYLDALYLTRRIILSKIGQSEGENDESSSPHSRF